MLRPIRFSLLLCVAFAAPSHAQLAPQLAPAESAATPPLLSPAAPALEGTITLQEGEITRTATLRFAAPNQLRVELSADDASGAPAQTLVSSGDDAVIKTPVQKRAFRPGFNPAVRPYRDQTLLGGGAANIALFGLTAEAASADYTAQSDATKITLTAKPGVGQTFAREDVRFGGTGQGAFYAAFKRVLFNRPAQIEVALQDGHAAQIIERDEENRETGRAQITYAGALPTLAVVSRNGIEVARYKYDLKTRATAFPAATFERELPTRGELADGALLENTPNPELLTAALDISPEGAFSRGVLRWRVSEEYAAALKDWNYASQGHPNATAPQFAICDAALQARDAPTALGAITKLRALLGEAEPEVALRRAQLARSLRDWASADAAFVPALQAHPNHAPLLYLRAQLMQTRGDFANAATSLQTLLKIPNVPARARLNAAELLRQVKPDFDASAALSGEAQAVFRARQAERGGDFASAQTAWTQLSSSPIFGAEALAHTIALAAVRGSTTDSLRAWRELAARALNSDERMRARTILLNAWRRANKQNALRSALQNRALGSAATEDDWQLWIDFQRLHGAQADLQSALEAGTRKFSQNALWQSQFAETILAGRAANPRLQFASALAAVSAAIKAEPSQAYFHEQRALILLQRDGERLSGETKRALDDLGRDFPNDPDAQLSLALIRARDLGAVPGAIAQVSKALQLGAPDENSRHQFVTAARQSLASMLRRALKPDESARQYDLLLRAAHSANEEAIVVANTLTLLGDTEDASGVAALIARLGSELWPASDWRQLMQVSVRALLARRTKPAAVLTALKANKSPGARLAAAYISRIARLQAQFAADAPEAPVATEEVLRRAIAADDALVPDLQTLATNAATPPLLSARAAFLLSERALDAGQPAPAATFLQRAVTVEPRDEEARFQLISALLAAKQTDAAKTERDKIARTLVIDADTSSRLVSLQLQLGENAPAQTDANAFMNALQIAPDASPADYQIAALLAARANFASGAANRGAQLYTALADEQWATEDRAAALLDLATRAQTANDADTAARAQAQLAQLNPSAQELSLARNLLASLN